MIKIFRLGEISPAEIFKRNEPLDTVSGVVSEIIGKVAAEGDSALIAYERKFDCPELTTVKLSDNAVREGVAAVPESFMRVLRRAADNITAFHKNQIRQGFIYNDRPGVVAGQKVVPIEKVAIYVPGGLAAYPSTVLMAAIPAKLAGCREVYVATPPSRNGTVKPEIIAAAEMCGVDGIFTMGGAQAVAALAYGTETDPKVDKIVGPGNAYVAEAKKQVFGRVSIDMIAGPSEILIIADGKSDPKVVAADMLSQAEHDKNASSVLVTDSEKLAADVCSELYRQLELLDRKEIALPSIENNGKIIIAASVAEAIEVSNEIAPEHLELMLDDPFDYLDMVKNAGSVFMGRNTPEALGDYMAGPNHTLPTGGTAKFASPLSVDDFVKKIQYSYFSRDALLDICDDVARFAEAEGLTGHARSAVVRKEGSPCSSKAGG